MWCFHAEKAYPKKSSFPSPLCLSKLPPFKMLSKENVYLLWQRTTYQPRNPQSATFHSWDQYSSGVEEGTLKSCIFSRKAATPQQKQVERIRDEKTEMEGAAMRRMLRQGAGMAAFAGNETHKATRGEQVEQSLKQYFWRVVNGITETGPYWTIMWVMQRVSNSHVQKNQQKNSSLCIKIPTWNHQAAVKDLKCQCSAFTSPA